MAPVKSLRRRLQPEGDERRPVGAGWLASGTSGAPGGLSGDDRRALLAAWTFSAAIAAGVCTLNALTRMHDEPIGVLRPIILEGSSWLTTLVALLIPGAVALWMRRTSPPLLAALRTHAVAAVAYSALHVAGFEAVRAIAFPVVLHTAYETGPLARELPYEFGKDVLVYAIATVGFWRLLNWSLQGAGQAAAPSAFDIRDGARLMRTPIAEIVAVRSAGNYVEFLLSDGRRPLMRMSLASAESKLAMHGFVRTHRSWLVNASRMTGLRPEGSGDYAVELGEVEAPLSRRFPKALTALRG